MNSTDHFGSAAAIFRWGVLLSAGLLVLGSVGLLFQPDTDHFRQPALSIAELLSSLRQAAPTALLQLAVMLLLLLPAVVTVALVVSFLRRGERVYAGAGLALCLALLWVWVSAYS